MPMAAGDRRAMFLKEIFNRGAGKEAGQLKDFSFEFLARCRVGEEKIRIY